MPRDAGLCAARLRAAMAYADVGADDLTKDMEGVSAARTRDAMRRGWDRWRPGEVREVAQVLGVDCLWLLGWEERNMDPWTV